MSLKPRTINARCALAVGCLLVASPASAADYYAGKSIDLLIGAPPAGGISAPRATGSSGIDVAPSSNDPNPASTLRREVLRASARAEFSDNTSSHFMGNLIRA